MRILEIYNSNLTTGEKVELKFENVFNPVGVKVHQMEVGSRAVYVLDQYIDGVKSNTMYSIDIKVIENIWSSTFHKGFRKMFDMLCKNKVVIVDYDNRKASVENSYISSSNDYNIHIVNDFKEYINMLENENE